MPAQRIKWQISGFTSHFGDTNHDALTRHHTLTGGRAAPSVVTGSRDGTLLDHSLPNGRQRPSPHLHRRIEDIHTRCQPVRGAGSGVEIWLASGRARSDSGSVKCGVCGRARRLRERGACLLDLEPKRSRLAAARRLQNLSGGEERPGNLAGIWA